jgi:hypothetical protein
VHLSSGFNLSSEDVVVQHAVLRTLKASVPIGREYIIDS